MDGARRGNNRRKGCNAERKYAKAFRELGFSNCRCTRQTSRLLDACKVDLDGLPLNVQIKAGKQHVNYRKVLQEMHTELSKYETGLEDRVSLVLHELDVGSGNRRKPWDTLVVLPFKDFARLLQGEILAPHNESSNANSNTENNE